MDADLLPVLVRIQSSLDSDLSAATLARETGWSESSLQRRIGAATGETPRRHIERLRVERAALQLLHRESTILEVALDNGFASHEVFTRAFRRRFDVTPSEWRERQRAEGLAEHGREPGLSESAEGVAISTTRLVELRAIEVAFLRHVGPYEQVPSDLWSRVRQRLETLGSSVDGLPVGVGHDAPTITPPEQLRFDAGWTIRTPLPPDSGLGTEVIGGSTYAITTFVGPFSMLGLAYERIVRRLMSSADDVQMITAPVVEWYRTGSINEDAYLNQIDISFPVRARAGGRRVFE